METVQTALKEISSSLSKLQSLKGLPNTPKQIKQAKVKVLSRSEYQTISEMNKARKLAGLKPLEIKVRKCLGCGRSFESIGNRFCGCLERETGTLAGRDVL